MRVFGAVLVIVLVVSSQQVRSQTKTQSPDDVVRTKTELVQTDVTVVDKRGRFVEGLNAEDFELHVDSRLQPLSFFEQVRAGSGDEEKQLTAARRGDESPGAPTPVRDRERVSFFCVEGLHLSG